MSYGQHGLPLKTGGGLGGRSPPICNQNEIINVIKGAEKCGS